MANSRKRCSHCKKYFPPESGIQRGTQFFCSKDHLIEYAANNTKSLASKGRKIQAKAERKELRQRKQDLKPRKYWYDRYQDLLNQWIVHVRDAGKPCCTCGTTNPNIKYDAGHFIAIKRGGVDPRRFETTNIHKQCSLQCNVHGSGMRLEYEKFIIDKYGADHLDWLVCDANHKSLKEQFPTIESIKSEMARYRVLLREAGLKPCQ